MNQNALLKVSPFCTKLANEARWIFKSILWIFCGKETVSNAWHFSTKMFQDQEKIVIVSLTKTLKFWFSTPLSQPIFTLLLFKVRSRERKNRSVFRRGVAETCLKFDRACHVQEISPDFNYFLNGRWFLSCVIFGCPSFSPPEMSTAVTATDLLSGFF